MNRRQFAQSAGACLLLGAAPAIAQLKARADKRERLACNSWPFRAYFDAPQLRQFRDPAYPLLTQWTFPEFLADTFGIHSVEFLPQHFADTSAGTIQKVKNGLKKAGSRCCNIMGLDLPGGVYAENADAKALLKETERWLNVAGALDCPSITIALTGDERPSPKVAAKNLRPLVDLAAHHGKKVLFHNDDMKRESAEILTAVINELGRTRTGTCPDFGNFAVKSADYALDQLRVLAPLASNICHAKDGIADGGVLYRDDFAASMKVMRDSGFRGLYSLEFEGLGKPLDGVRKLLEQTLDNLS